MPHGLNSESATTVSAVHPTNTYVRNGFFASPNTRHIFVIAVIIYFQAPALLPPSDHAFFFCSNIDLDQLATKEGYRHHPSCANLLASAKHGCESCKLIWDSQDKYNGGDLDNGYDLGPLETQIIARVVGPNKEPGRYERIRYGQEERWEHGVDNGSFLWTFLAVATESGQILDFVVVNEGFTDGGR